MTRRSTLTLTTMSLLSLAVAAFPQPSFAQLDIGPAPDGEPIIVAQKIISDNFDPSICPLVVRAARLGDGSINAICDNLETFRVFRLLGKDVAMRCSVANSIGISC